VTAWKLLLSLSLFAGAWAGWSRLALAQGTPSVSPPVVQHGTDVPYPRGAQGDAEVVLELVVTDDGTVAEVRIIEGSAPFAEHARRAVAGWRFAPARRDGVVVAARIKARIEFSAPAPKPVAEAPAAQQPKSPPELEEPLEVTVLGERREVGVTTLSAAEVRELPGAFGDPFRAVEALPGVAPLMSGVPYFYMRGAPPNNNGYYVDDIRVPLLFHVGFGPGVIHPGLLERLDFYPGAAPASYGGSAGATIAGPTRAPAGRAHGEAGIRLVDTGALLESPFADGRASALVAGRYGYPGPVVSAFSDIRLGYWDYQSRATLRLGAHDTLSLLVFGSHDELAHEDDFGETVEDFVSDFHRVDLRHEHVWRSGLFRVAATLGYDSQGANPLYLTNRSAVLRLAVEEALWQSLRLRAGMEGRLDAYGLKREMPAERQRVEPTSVDPAPTHVTPAAYADLVWRATSKVELVPGLRATVFDSTRGDEHTTVAALDPRLATRVTVAPSLAWLSNFGLAHQYPALRLGGSVPSALISGEGFPIGEAQLQKTLHMSQGVEAALPAEVVMSITGFSSRFWGMTDLTASCLQIEAPEGPAGEGPMPDDPFYCPSDAPVRGYAYGLELLARRPLSKRLGGMLSYTLSRSVRESHFVTLDGQIATATVPSEFDRTHILSAVVAYALGRGWRAGSRFAFYTGAPYSNLAGNVPVPPYNSRRDPPYTRLDVRLEKRWQLGDEQFIAFVIEGQNVTLNKEANTLGMDCRGEATLDTYTTECERGEVGPLTIPSLGVEAVF
jgi:TonB family protein